VHEVAGYCTWTAVLSTDQNWHLKNLPPRIGYVFKLNRIRVDQPIIIHLPMTKHLFISSFWVIQNVRGVLFQAIEIIFEMQRKRCNEKNNKTKNNLSNLQNMVFFFSLFGPLLLSNLIILLFFIHFQWFKVLQECHLKFCKSYLNSDSNRATYKDFFECSEISLCIVVFCGFFFEFLTLYTLGGHNFIIFNLFFTMLLCQMCQEEGFRLCWDTKNNRTLPLDLACPECLIVQSLTDLT
jgi:hypothetical protein